MSESILERVRQTALATWRLTREGRYPYQPPERIQRDQNRRVREMVAYAYEYVPFYREAIDALGQTPADFASAEDLARLPIVQRDIIQRDPEKFFSRAFRREDCLEQFTGGSTGAPLAIFHDAAAALQFAAQGERFRRVVTHFTGRSVGYREALVLPTKSQNIRMRRFWWKRSIRVPGLPCFRLHLSMFDPPEKNVPLLNEFRPDVLCSYGSYLALLFHWVRDTGAAFHRPKVVCFGADGLPDSGRRLIREEFGVPALSAYHTVEAPRLSFECEEHAGLHVNSDLFPVRIADPDGRTVPHGESGNVIVSNLVTRAMVLLNYRLGDRAAWVGHSCACGRNLPLLSYPHGRCDDWMELPDGRLVHSQLAICAIDKNPEVWSLQIIQNAPSRVTAWLVTAPGANREKLREKIAKAFAKEVSADMSVNILFTDQIPRTLSGKHRAFMSEIPERKSIPWQWQMVPESAEVAPPPIVS